MYKLMGMWKTPFLMSPDDGTGGGASTDSELPENLRDKYVSIDKLNGTRGALEQQVKRYRSEAEKAAGEKEALEGQISQLSEQLTKLSKTVEGAGALQSELETLKGSMAAQTALNARFKSALKYPQLLSEAVRDSTLALIESSTLDAEALEAHLGKLASAFGSAAPAAPPPPDAGAGATPPQPKGTQPKASDLMAEAEQARREGKLDVWQSKMRDALALMDAENPFAPPKVERKPL